MKEIWAKLNEGDAVLIRIEENKYVSDLKEAIKSKLHPKLDAVALDDIHLRLTGENDNLAGNRLVSTLTCSYDEPIVIINEELKKSVKFNIEAVLTDMQERQSDMQERQSDMQERQSRLFTLVEVVARENARKYYYTSDKKTSVSRNVDFKKDLLNFYYGITEPTFAIRCMFSGIELPFQAVIASHLFKYSWKSDCKSLLGIDNIDNPRNGLLLFKPFEYAFDSSHICFEYDANIDKFRLKLLLKGIESKTIHEYICEESLKDKRWFKSKSEWEAEMKKHMSIDAIVTNMKVIDNFESIYHKQFSEFSGKEFNYNFTTEFKCYYRCLSFQSQMAKIHAVDEEWISRDELDSPGMWSDLEDNKKQVVSSWLHAVLNERKVEVDD